MSKNNEILIKMLSDEPKLYEIINSKEFMKVLEVLENGSFDFIYIKGNVGKDIYIKKDIILYNILDSLINRNLVQKVKVNEKEFYYLTEKGKQFYTIYKESRKNFIV